MSSDRESQKSPLFRTTIGILISLFICPGMGHRYVGRKLAGIMILAVFIGTFLFILVPAVFTFVHETFPKLVASKKININSIKLLFEKAFEENSVIKGSVFLLVFIYIAAPIELLIIELMSYIRSKRMEKY